MVAPHADVVTTNLAGAVVLQCLLPNAMRLDETPRDGAESDAQVRLVAQPLQYAGITQRHDGPHAMDLDLVVTMPRAFWMPVTTSKCQLLSCST